MALVLQNWTDVSLSFIPNPNTGDIAMNVGTNAISASIRNLVLTNFRPFHPELESNLGSMMFELIDSVSARAMSDTIVTIITQYEPRATSVSCSVTVTPDANSVNVTVNYTPINTLNNVTVNIPLTRTH